MDGNSDLSSNRCGWVCVIGWSLMLLSACAEGSRQEPEKAAATTIGAASVAVTDIAGRSAGLVGAAADGPRVLVFVRRDCPISNRYAPVLQGMFARYSGDGVQFHLVYPDPEDDVERIERHRTEYGLTVPAIHDPDHRVVEAVGATMTPEAAVFATDGTMVYRGRIDDRYVSFGQARPRAQRHDVIETLDALVNGDTPAPRTEEAVGCAIAGLAS